MYAFHIVWESGKTTILYGNSLIDAVNTVGSSLE